MIPAYSRFWTEDDELRLREEWSDEDKGLLAATHVPKCALLRRCEKLLRLPPPDLLPFGQSVNIDRNRQKRLEGIPQPVLNTNWSGDFCVNMSAAISLPAFDKNPEFFRYVVALSRYHHLGSEDATKPDDEYFCSDGAAAFLKDVCDEMEVDEDGDTINMLREFLRVRFGPRPLPNLPRHFEFSKKLKGAVQSIKDSNKIGGTEPDGLIHKDFMAITIAWDSYRETSIYRLEKAKFYDTKMSSDRRRVLDRETILAMKKDGILASRRSRIRDIREESGDTDLWCEEDIPSPPDSQYDD
ncbi:hypothetical protein NHQ30_007231 [Ciborinia camelliae]|nr:hypothetical protein NHQ30_007231 [Ciborinia camelliae]